MCAIEECANKQDVIWVAHGTSLVRAAPEQLRAELPSERAHRLLQPPASEATVPVMDQVRAALRPVRAPVRSLDLLTGSSLALLCSVVDGLVHVQAEVLGVHFGQHGSSCCVGTLHAAQLVVRIVGHHNQTDSTTISPGKKSLAHVAATGVRLDAGRSACPADPCAFDQGNLGVRLFVSGTSKLFESQELVHQGQR